MIDEEYILPDGLPTGLQPSRVCWAIVNQDVEQKQSWLCAAAVDLPLAGV